jgi:hypothetical protein
MHSILTHLILIHLMPTLFVLPVFTVTLTHAHSRKLHSLTYISSSLKSFASERSVDSTPCGSYLSSRNYICFHCAVRFCTQIRTDIVIICIIIPYQPYTHVHAHDLPAGGSSYLSTTCSSCCTPCSTMHATIAHIQTSTSHVIQTQTLDTRHIGHHGILDHHNMLLLLLPPLLLPLLLLPPLLLLLLQVPPLLLPLLLLPPLLLPPSLLPPLLLLLLQVPPLLLPLLLLLFRSHSYHTQIPISICCVHLRTVFQPPSLL